MVRVMFEPDGVSVDVSPGTTVLDAARSCGVGILATCAGQGTCGKCGVRLITGKPGRVQKSKRPAVPMPADVYLSCLLEVESPVTVRVLSPLRPTVDGQ